MQTSEVLNNRDNNNIIGKAKQKVYSGEKAKFSQTVGFQSFVKRC